MHNEKENEQSRENISGNCNTGSCVVFYVQYVADAKRELYIVLQIIKGMVLMNMWD